MLQVLLSPTTVTGTQISLLFFVKITVLVLALVYGVFAVRVWVQARRIQKWLPFMGRAWHGNWALIHIVLALVGIGLVIFLL